MKMKPARNALKGYTYQNYIFTLLLAKMDVDRKIKKIISEATDTKDFDDAYIEYSDGSNYCVQVKNYSDLRMGNITIDRESSEVYIGSNKNEYDPNDNNVLIVNGDLKEPCLHDFMGLDAIIKDGITIVPLPQDKAADIMEDMYRQESRLLQIIQYGYKCICAGKFEVTQDDLPPVITISMDLEKKTIIIRRPLRQIEKGINHIVGKPGVGKSHYVNELLEEYPNAIIYRFWIGQQDPRINDRLRFDVFLEQIGLMAFNSPRSFDQEALINQIRSDDKILIIDGLDHVENYNNLELSKYIDFLAFLEKSGVQTVLLSRPMKQKMPWDKMELLNWSFDEAALYLEMSYAITDYATRNRIFDITNGYPIITHYLAEHYVKYKDLNVDTKVESIDDYYSTLIEDVNVKSLLGIFAVNNSFFTLQEIEGFCEKAMYRSIVEFMHSYPYLFDMIENRVSLVHDSFNTYLRSHDMADDWIGRLNRIVTEKLLSGEVEYMARFSSFRLDEDTICRLIKTYADFGRFEELIKATIDFNSIKAFYQQLQCALETRPGILNIYQYYSFTLIYQVVTRNDLVGYEALIYQMLVYINRKEEICNQIFSSGIIWNVYLAYKGKKRNLELYLKNTMYGAEQADVACDNINTEIDFFNILELGKDTSLILKDIDSSDKDALTRTDLLQEYLELIWIHKDENAEFYPEFKEYIETGRDHPLYRAIKTRYQIEDVWLRRMFTDAKYRLHELGFFGDGNMFRKGSILEIIKEKAPEGSFNVHPLILSYLRLANREGRTVDIFSINYVWTIYFQRKDFSVLTIGDALISFEKYGLINEGDSIEIINRLLGQSENGIRHLLALYINKKGPEYTNRLVSSGKIYDKDLRLDCFDLNKANIDCLPMEVIEERTKELISRNIKSKYVDGNEIGNVLGSKYSDYVIGALDYWKIAVKGGLTEDIADLLEDIEIEYFNDNEYANDVYTPFKHGYIHREDFDYIRQTGMSVMECSKYTGVCYDCIPYVELYELFDKKEIERNFLIILHQALFARVISNEYIGDWKNIIGNIPKLLDKYSMGVDWKRLFSIMLSFLDISFIYYPAELHNIPESKYNEGSQT